ncbi:MAG: hypothetical protein EBE86_015920 [Hormoscilla sp. GUM202]|nr:hypothetical protein [Hormoscilla sp. GM7CHS1pb]MBO1348773.1 hypothetical protein [Hormoscilla sp. GUM202]
MGGSVNDRGDRGYNKIKVYWGGLAMTQLVLPDLNPIAIEKLKARAQRHGYSLEEELKSILEQGVSEEVVDPLAVVLQIRQQLAGRKHSDSGVLQREEREL